MKQDGAGSNTPSSELLGQEMIGLAVTSAISLPSPGEQGWGTAVIVTSHFLSNVTVQGQKRSSLPQLPSWGKAAKHSPWNIPCAWRPQSDSPFPTPSLSRIWLCDCCFAQALGELQPAAKQGWKRNNKEVTLAGFPSCICPGSKAASQAQRHMMHAARCQR